ncbi:TonB-dependent receptor domain-containing protein [Microbulbifer yueqingensis]|uniref:TonB-dependent Receptor Plug Domain n=1 Tax=Microbulbifer yueqingensis TaxID=658219 RepID=A0A1G8VQ93_9GAMM|nr:TonB-dependent receptor [Microbulbifer yueqingensis]SDJ68047.1 TonB-dependent Receptor Plug Domain [Microbulbifer yueqingensis]
MKKNLLSVAVKGAIGFTAAAVMVPAMPAFAQEDATMVEEVVVTGSRIKRADLDSSSPVTVLTAEEMQATGITDVGDLLQRLPAMSGSPIGTTTNNGGNGSVQVDLRGLGPIRTLTLVNGKRTVDGGDYQTIPAVMIERVEILKDGASAAYGADAVAGVVNIITKKNVDGITLQVQNSDSFEADAGAQDSVSFIAGKTFDGGNVTFGAEYVKQEEIYQSDTPWDFFQNSYYIYPDASVFEREGPTSGYPLGSSRIPEGRLTSGELVQRTDSSGAPLFLDADGEFTTTNTGQPAFRNPIYMNPGDGLTAFDGRTYNYAPVNYIQTPYERVNIFSEANFDLTENTRFYSEFRANLRSSAQELAPQPYNSPTDPAYLGTYTPIDPLTGEPLREVNVGTADEPDWVYTADQTMGQVVDPIAYSGISEDNYYNTLGAPIIDARRRVVETPRRFEQEITQFQAIAGLQGSIQDWDWEVAYNKGFRERADADFGQFYGPNLRNAMGPSADLDGDGTPECYTDINDPSTRINGCVPIDLFSGAGGITDEMLAYVGTTVVDTFTMEQDQFNASITGDLIEMPAGALSAAFGYDYRREHMVYNPDSAKVADEVTGNTGAGTEGGYTVNSVFSEFFAPLYDNGTQAVDMTLGLRWDDYSTFGSDTVYQLGLEAQIIEGVKFRATQGEVFRAPSIGELFAGQVDSFPSYSDPCTPDTSGNIAPGCAQSVPQGDTQVLAKVGGNPNLEAETGDTLTAGFVITPELPVGDLSVTLDYWKTEMDNLITSLGAQYILDDCYVNGNASACDLVTRRSDYTIAQVVDAGLNAASLTAEGVDTEVRYGFDTEFGRFETNVLWVHQLENSRVAFDGAESEEQVGTMAGNGQIYAQDKVNYSVNWYWNDLSVSYLGEYIGEIDAPASFIDYTQTVDAQLYHDLAAAYTFPTQTRVSMGVTNLTNEEPPYIDFGFNASTDPSTYRLFGRSYYLRVSQEF